MTKLSSKNKTITGTTPSGSERKQPTFLETFGDPGFIAQQRIVTEKAVSRMGLNSWSQMAWFVKLVNANGFESMTDGEQLLWKEEFVAMWFLKENITLIAIPPDTKRYPRSPQLPRHSSGQTQDYGMPPPLTSAQMQEARDVIAKHINELADDRGTLIGGFDITYTISFHKNAAYDQNPKVSRYLIYRGETGGAVYNIYQFSFLLHASKLLEKYADKVRRCDHCKNVFLQVKRTGKYCGSKCYTVAGMRRLRTERKTQMPLKMKAKKQSRRIKGKGEAGYGTKKR